MDRNNDGCLYFLGTIVIFLAINSIYNIEIAGLVLGIMIILYWAISGD